MTMYRHQGRKFKRSSSIYTPSGLAKFLRDLLAPVVVPKVVLDPCIGTGQLVAPWVNDSQIIGVDIESNRGGADLFIQYPFDIFSTWEHPVPDLILCNPPFNGGETQMMWPERFLRTMVSLFGRDMPIVLFCPHGFRLNQRGTSKRLLWMRDYGPKISSVITLPIDTFPETLIASEVLIFNVSGLDPHYWYSPERAANADSLQSDLWSLDLSTRLGPAAVQAALSSHVPNPAMESRTKRARAVS